MQPEKRSGVWMKALRRFRIASAILLFACAPALAHPALWVVKSPTATVYLFGTIHALPEGMHWHYPALDRALAASDSLYVEEDDSSRAKMTALILKYGVNSVDRVDLESLLTTHPAYHPHIVDGNLSSYIPRLISAARLNVAARRAGLPVTALEAMQPWTAALALTVASTDRSGYEPQFGADTELEHEFRADHKPVHSFETSRQQVEIFAGLPLDVQLELLRGIIDEQSHDTVQVADLARSWQAGDITAIADAVLDQLHTNHSEVYDLLLLDRNRKWAGQIEDLLKQHGTVFVAVGVGHLAGSGSLQAQLATLGFKAERVH